MPTSIGHSLSGIAVSSLFASRPHVLRVVFLCVLCSVFPDFDAVGLRLGVPYQHWLGHRGFSHSILFAVFLALIALLFILNSEKSLKKRALFFTAFFACVLLHDILDAMTNGGLGVAFFSPFSERRFFLPWRLIEAPPFSPRYLITSRGLAMMRSELVWVMIPSLCISALSIGIRKLYRYFRADRIEATKCPIKELE